MSVGTFGACALCGDELATAGQRTCGVDVCSACHDGDLRIIALTLYHLRAAASAG